MRFSKTKQMNKQKYTVHYSELYEGWWVELEVADKWK